MNPVILCGKNKAFEAFLRRALPEDGKVVLPDCVSDALRLARETDAQALFLLPDYDLGQTEIPEFDDAVIEQIAECIRENKTTLYIENYPAYDYRDCHILGAQALGFQRRIGTDSIRLSPALAEKLGFTLLQKRLGYSFPGFNRSAGENALLEIRDCTGTHHPVREAKKAQGCGLVQQSSQVYCAMFDLTHFDDFCTTPYVHWQKLYAHLFSQILALPEKQVSRAFAASFRKVDTAWPQAHKREENTRKADLEEAVRNAVKWHLISGILPAQDGSRGVYEMIRSFDLNCAKNIRGDSSLFTAALFAAAGAYFHEPQWLDTARTLTHHILSRKSLQIREGDNRGLFKWFAGVGGLGPKSVFTSDCARVGMNLLALSRILADSALKSAVLELGEALLTWFGGHGLFPGAGFLEYDRDSIRALQNEEHALTAPEYYEPVMILFKNLYRETGDDRYRIQVLRTAEAMAAVYPNYKIGAALSRGFTYSRLFGIFACAQTFSDGPWTPLIEKILDEFSALQQPCGGIAEAGAYAESLLLNLNVGLGGTAQAEQNDEEKEILEFAVGFGPGHDCIADLMYCCNTLLPALSILDGTAYRTRLDMARIHRMKDALCDFLLNVQISSDDPRLDGGWMRAFDMELGEYFGCARDIAWGPYSILTGWMTGCIPLCFLEQLGFETIYGTANRH